MWWPQTKQSPPSCVAAFRPVALSLVGDRSQYPALKSLGIRRSAYPSRTDGESNAYLPGGCNALLSILRHYP